MATNSYFLSSKNGTIRIGTVASINANDNLPVTYIYSYTGANQISTKPSNFTHATIECWGAGGALPGPSGGASQNTYANGTGGGGGYTKATFDVTGVSSLIVIVGEGGKSYANPNVSGTSAGNTFGGGGGGNRDGNWGTGSGGGRSSVQLNLGTDVITAGGGGAAGHAYGAYEARYGGDGGETTGGSASAPFGGTGGTQLAGGTTVGGSNGTQYQGGTAAGGVCGGGGGYYGGGSGGFGNSGGADKFGGGGGGSSYVARSGPLIGLNSTFTQGSLGLVANSAGLPSSNKNVGNGGVLPGWVPLTSSMLASNQIKAAYPGQNGLVVITYFNKVFNSISNANLMFAYSFETRYTQTTTIGNIASDSPVYLSSSAATVASTASLVTTNILYGDRSLTNATLTLPNSITFTTNGITFSFWLLSSNATLNGMFGFAPTVYSDNNSIFCYGNSANTFQFWTSDGGSNGSWGQSINIPNVGNGKWHHFVLTITFGTYASSTLNVYYDNTNVNSNYSVYYPPNQTYNFNCWNAIKGSFGFQSNASNLANVRVYNRVITVSEIGTLYTNGL